MSGHYYPTQIGRPAVLTVVGVVSIIIASVSMLADFGSLGFSNIVLAISGRGAAAGTAFNSPTFNPPATAHAASGEYVPPEGLSADQRRIVIIGLGQVRPISEPRQKQLDGLLADVGRNVIRLSPDSLTTDRVVSYVTDARDMPSGSGGAADDMFTLGSGRLQISDTEAVFFPDNSPSPIRSGGGSYTDSSGLSHLASAQIAAVVDRAKSLCSQTILDTQVSALEAELEAPSQNLITPSASVAEAAAQVTSVQALGDGTIAITTTGTTISIGPNGQVMQGLMPASAMNGPWGKGPIVQRRDATMLMLDAVLSFAAAGFLLACGIVLLRNRPMARWMYYAYGVGKILLVVLSCYAVYSVALQLAKQSPDAQSTAMAWMLITALPGAIFPVVVLVVMSLRMTREFLGVETVGRIF